MITFNVELKCWESFIVLNNNKIIIGKHNTIQEALQSYFTVAKHYSFDTIDEKKGGIDKKKYCLIELFDESSIDPDLG